MLVGIENGLGNVGLVQIAGGHGGLDGHDLHVVGNTHNTHVIVLGSNNTGNVGAVAVIVIAAALACHDVDTVVVVNVAVAVVVNAVVGSLGSIHPDVVRQILMGIVHTGINNSHDHTGAAAGNGHLTGAGGDAAVIEVPLLRHLGIIQPSLGQGFVLRHGGGLNLVVVVHHHNFAQSAQGFHRFCDVGAHQQLGFVPGGCLHRHNGVQSSHTGSLHAGGDRSAIAVVHLDQQGSVVKLHLLLGHHIGIHLVEGDLHGAVFVIEFFLLFHVHVGGILIGSHVGSGIAGGNLAGILQQAGDQFAQGHIVQLGHHVIGEAGTRAGHHVLDQIGDLFQALPVLLHLGRLNIGAALVLILVLVFILVSGAGLHHLGALGFRRGCFRGGSGFLRSRFVLCFRLDRNKLLLLIGHLHLGLRFGRLRCFSAGRHAHQHSHGQQQRGDFLQHLVHNWFLRLHSRVVTISLFIIIPSCTCNVNKRKPSRDGIHSPHPQK